MSQTTPASPRPMVAQPLVPASRTEVIPDEGPAPRGKIVEALNILETEAAPAAQTPASRMEPAPVAAPAEAASPAPEAQPMQPIGAPAAAPVPEPQQQPVAAVVPPTRSTPPRPVALVAVEPEPTPVTALTVPPPVIEPIEPEEAEVTEAPRTAAPTRTRVASLPRRRIPPVPRTAESTYERGLAAYEQQQYDAALRMLQQYLVDFPDSSLADNAAYWIAECFYSQRQFALAAEQFAMVVALYPESNKVPDALLKEAYALAELGRPQEARVLFERILAEHGTSTAAPLASSRLAQLR